MILVLATSNGVVRAAAIPPEQQDGRKKTVSFRLHRTTEVCTIDLPDAAPQKADCHGLTDLPCFSDQNDFIPSHKGN